MKELTKYPDKVNKSQFKLVIICAILLPLTLLFQNCNSTLSSSASAIGFGEFTQLMGGGDSYTGGFAAARAFAMNGITCDNGMLSDRILNTEKNVFIEIRRNCQNVENKINPSEIEVAELNTDGSIQIIKYQGKIFTKE